MKGNAMDGGFARRRGKRAETAGKQAPVLAPAGPRATRSMLEGELANVGLCTLLTILDMERRSGVVTLHRAGGSGLLHVRDGRVVRASVEGARLPRAGREAVFELLTWTEGRFELWPGGQEPVADEVGESTTHLLLEAARRADEAAGATPERAAASPVLRAAALAW